MTHRISFTLRSLCSVVLALLVVGCASRRAETNVMKKPLPAHPPTLAPFELTQTASQQRLTPKESITSRDTAEVRLSTTDEIPADAPVVLAAQQAAPVQAKLGARYFFIDAEPITRRDPFCLPTKPTGQQSVTPMSRPTTRVTYFSYTHNAPVIVCMREQEFVSLASIPKDYQPPEGDGEIEEAKRVARLDERIRENVRGLEAHVLLADPEWRLWWWNAEGYGHRVFYVTFSEGRSGDPQYYAVVDLTEERDQDKVRQAGVEPRR